MYQQIKQLADDALVLQNKDGMDSALRQISVLCDQAAEQQPEQPKQRSKKQVDQQPAGTNGADAQEGGAQ
jgi:hypothetical protein